MVAAGKLFVVDREVHTVYALDANSGDAAWSFTAGGRIDCVRRRPEFASVSSSAKTRYDRRAEIGIAAFAIGALPSSGEVVD